MSKEKLKHSGGNSSLKSEDTVVSVTAADTQQLRTDNEETAYKSEEHRHTYQSTNQSFDTRRDEYAEQAMNTSGKYDYEACAGTILETDKPPWEWESRSYVSVAENRIPRGTGSTDVDSIFSASDAELANAIDYLEKHNDKYGHQVEKVEKKTEKTKKKIGQIERKRLEYSSTKRRIGSDDEKVQLLKRTQKSQYCGKEKSQGIEVTIKTQLPGRLKFSAKKTAISAGEHNSDIRRKENRFDRRYLTGRQLSKSIKSQALGSEFQEDDIEAEMKRKGSRAARNLLWGGKRKYRRLKHELDGYNRLKHQNMRLASLNAQNTRIAYKSGIDLQKRKADEAMKQELLREKNKKKIKKEMVQNYKREQGNFFKRVKNQHHLKKTTKKKRRMARKRIKAISSSIAGLSLIIIILLLFIVLFVFMAASLTGDTYVNTVSQNDYYDMTEVTSYFREKESKLEEDIKPENLEPIILAEESDIYEFVYDMADISFDANTLVAYLSAKYNEFDLEKVMADLDEIFEQYYTLEWEVKLEEREIPDETQPRDPVTGKYPLVKKMVKICYVRLIKADFYELLKGRIDDTSKQNQMDGFYLTGNGQQVYGPVMNVDWRKKITSNYGWRIHPITGVKTFHKGVDIAVPTGTALYSAVTGTVTKSYYSDSGGNMIVIKNENGWEITFMHMDSRTVYPGDVIEKGQLVGYSGNTGNSTGPHLHLQVEDSEGNPVNPVFIVPFSTIEASETF